MADETDVKEAALLELPGDYTAWEFADDNAFQDWLDVIIERVVADQGERVGSSYSLDDSKLFDAAVFETESRMLRRSVALGWESFRTGGGESITIGPIRFEQTARSAVSITGIQDLAEQMHRRAEQRLMSYGVPGRGGAIRTWTPSCRISKV